jgi:hypothetical protein
MPLIILQSNQPNPAAVMAMTDDGDEPQQYWPTPRLIGMKQNLTSQSVLRKQVNF